MLIAAAGLFLVYALASLAWASNVSLSAGANLGTLTIAFIVGYRYPRTMLLWWAFLLYVTFNTLGAMVFYTWLPWGLFGNPNYLGVAIAMALAVSIIHPYHFWWFWPVAILGLPYSESRTAFIGAAVAIGIATWRWSRVAATIWALGLLTAGHLAGGKGSGSQLQRLGIWQDTLNHLSFFGSGWGSFPAAYADFDIKTNMTMVLAPHAYNDALELVFELGIGTIPLWVFLILVLERAAPERLIAWTFLAMSLTYFPLHVPTVGLAFTFALGIAAQSQERTTQWSKLPAGA